MKKTRIKREWSEGEIAQLKELAKTKTFPEISKIMGRTAANLNWKATQLGIRRTNFRDYTGRKFCKITVVEFLFYNALRKSVWRCKCDCGNMLDIVVSNLVSGAQVSCGCIRREGQFETIGNTAMIHQKREVRPPVDISGTY